jgi:hypothetical protein
LFFFFFGSIAVRKNKLENSGAISLENSFWQTIVGFVGHAFPGPCNLILEAGFGASPLAHLM